MKIFIARRWSGASVAQEKKIKAKDRKTAELEFKKDKKLENGQWVSNYWHVY